MERRPRKQKKASDINKSLAKSNNERRDKLSKAFPIPQWILDR
jgi:hypothetical protein